MLRRKLYFKHFVTVYSVYIVTDAQQHDYGIYLH